MHTPRVTREGNSACKSWTILLPRRRGRYYSTTMHTVAILALDGVVAFDLSVPLEVFGRACLPGGQAAYRVQICAPTDEIGAGTFTLRAPWRLDMLAEADTIILPGLVDPTMPIPDDVLIALRNAAARGARIASICTNRTRTIRRRRSRRASARSPGCKTEAGSGTSDCVTSR